MRRIGRGLLSLARIPARVVRWVLAAPGLAGRSAQDAAARVAAPFLPEPGTTEGAVMLGLVLVGIGVFVAGFPGPAIFVPGGALVAIGLGFTFRRG